MRNDFGFDGPRRPLVWRILLWPFSAIRRLLATLSSGDDIQGAGGTAGMLKRILVSPINWTWSVGTTLLVNWSSSRSFRSFILGAPAFLFALITTGMVIFGSLNNDAVMNRYKNMFLEARKIAAHQAQLEAAAKQNTEVNPNTASNSQDTGNLASSDETPLSQRYLAQAELLLNRLIRSVPSEREDNQVKKAELLIDQKKLPEAAAILSQLVRPGEAGNPLAHLLLGQYYLTEEFRASRGFDKLSAPDRLRFTLQTHLVAEQHLEQVLLSAQPEFKRQAHVFLYQLYAQRRMFEMAARSLEFLAAGDPRYAAAHYRFFTTTMKLPKTADDMADRNHKFFRDALAKDPDNVQIWKLKTTLYVQQKRFDEAMVDLNQGLQSGARTETKAFLQGLQSEVLLESAVSLVATRGEKESRVQRLTLLSEAVRLNPGNRSAIEQLVILGFPLENDATDQWLYEAKANAPLGSPVFYGVNMVLGLRAVFQGDNETAKTYLNAAAGMGPGFQLVLRALTLAIDPSATSMLDGTGETAPNELSTAPALFGIYMILGSRSVVEKEYARGLEFFRKAIEANPNSVTAQNNFAYCLINKPDATRADYERAVVLASANIEAAPHVPNFYETRGAVYLKLEEYNLAIADFETALQRNFPNRAMVHRNLVIACRGAGRNAEADAYQKMVDQADASTPADSPLPLEPVQSQIGDSTSREPQGNTTAETITVPKTENQSNENGTTPPADPPKQ